jgi:transcriptional regulator with XRE-family HTH domain
MSNTSRNPVAVAFGAHLRQLRTHRGISQDRLAHATGIHPTAIGRLERGGREPTLKTILRLAHGLGLQPGEMLTAQTQPQTTHTGSA